MVRVGFIEKIKCTEKNVRGWRNYPRAYWKSLEKGQSQYKHTNTVRREHVWIGQGSVQRSQWPEHRVQSGACRGQCEKGWL